MVEQRRRRKEHVLQKAMLSENRVYVYDEGKIFLVDYKDVAEYKKKTPKYFKDMSENVILMTEQESLQLEKELENKDYRKIITSLDPYDEGKVMLLDESYFELIIDFCSELKKRELLKSIFRFDEYKDCALSCRMRKREIYLFWDFVEKRYFNRRRLENDIRVLRRLCKVHRFFEDVGEVIALDFKSYKFRYYVCKDDECETLYSCLSITNAYDKIGAFICINKPTYDVDILNLLLYLWRKNDCCDDNYDYERTDKTLWILLDLLDLEVEKNKESYDIAEIIKSRYRHAEKESYNDDDDDIPF